jgi:hypothetical protein
MADIPPPRSVTAKAHAVCENEVICEGSVVIDFTKTELIFRLGVDCGSLFLQLERITPQVKQREGFGEVSLPQGYVMSIWEGNQLRDVIQFAFDGIQKELLSLFAMITQSQSQSQTQTPSQNHTPSTSLPSQPSLLQSLTSLPHFSLNSICTQSPHEVIHFLSPYEALCDVVVVERLLDAAKSDSVQ